MSVAEFFAMGGHGLYVWLAYAAGAGVVFYNVLSVRVRERRYLREHRDRLRRHGDSAYETSGAVARSGEGVE